MTSECAFVLLNAHYKKQNYIAIIFGFFIDHMGPVHTKPDSWASCNMHIWIHGVAIKDSVNMLPDSGNACA